jgi:hypothetical protein
LKLRGCTLLRPQPERAAEKENEKRPSLIFVSLPLLPFARRKDISKDVFNLRTQPRQKITKKEKDEAQKFLY